MNNNYYLVLECTIIKTESICWVYVTSWDNSVAVYPCDVKRRVIVYSQDLDFVTQTYKTGTII